MVFAFGNSSRRSAQKARYRLLLETLEERAVPALNVPIFHSNPDATVKLFLDFDGHFEPTWLGYTNITTPAYDFDGDRTSFSTEELANIEAVWFRVAEDFAPFNLDVTTEESPVLAEGAPIANANGVALRIAIGGSSTDWYGGGAGGAGAYNSFTNQTANVAYVFGQDSSSPAMANGISHEAGHSFGLYHQSTYDAVGNKTSEYNGGDFSTWTPIMGASMWSTVYQTWYNGPNSQGATVLQDDMAVLANTTNGFGYRSDDIGNTIGTATALTPSGNTWNGAGIVGTNTDVDMFSFTITSSDTYRLIVNGLVGPGNDTYASNLDAALELRNSTGGLIDSVNPSNTRSAEIRQALTPGTYYLAVKSNGVYGWVGQYSVNIDTPLPGITVTASSPTMTTGEDGRQVTFTVVLQTAPTSAVSIPISSTNTAEGAVSTSSLVFTAANWNVPQTVTITGVDDGIIDNDTPYSVVIGAATTADPEYSGLDPADIPVINLGNDAAGFVYFVNGSTATIARSRLNGSQQESLVDLKQLYGSSGTYTPRGLAVDMTNGKMYWTDSSAKRIQRANLDGSGVETVFSGSAVTGIALDTTAGKLYWVNTTDHKIQRANLDGTGIQDLVSNASLDIGGIALDLGTGKMYWSDNGQNVIQRSNLDGTSVETLWTGTEPSRPYAVVLDTAAGKMYWSDLDQNTISRADLNGTNVETLVNTVTDAMYLALDVPAGKLYWTNFQSQAVYRANLDGSFVALLEPGQGPRGIAVIHPGPDISVTHRTGVVTTEDGGNDVFRVTLTTQPTSNVTITLSSTDTTEGTLSTTSLTFTPANWNITQTVTVFGATDSLLDGDIAYSIILAPAVSSDPNYSSRNPADVSAINRDKAVNQTKFYVVNDATQNQTFEYNANGGSVETYNLNSGNAAPRGAASTAAGDKVWVVDANRTVYVYNASGGLLGSWSAGTLASNATVEGIATNGTDIWIVDAKSDKVYKYAGAATRLSGSQAATSSFSLSVSNSSPKDIVTDGVSLWVVDDSTTDRVFKYSIAGSYTGSWTIDAANSKPTGLTIDPTNVSNIWIVDSGTDKIYQYNGAVARVAGSQSAAAIYSLAVSNTNPQGIADPPAGIPVQSSRSTRYDRLIQELVRNAESRYAQPVRSIVDQFISSHEHRIHKYTTLFTLPTTQVKVSENSSTTHRDMANRSHSSSKNTSLRMIDSMMINDPK